MFHRVFCGIAFFLATFALPISAYCGGRWPEHFPAFLLTAEAIIACALVAVVISLRYLRVKWKLTLVTVGSAILAVIVVNGLASPFRMFGIGFIHRVGEVEFEKIWRKSDVLSDSNPSGADSISKFPELAVQLKNLLHTTIQPDIRWATDYKGEVHVWLVWRSKLVSYGVSNRHPRVGYGVGIDFEYSKQLNTHVWIFVGRG